MFAGVQTFTVDSITEVRCHFSSPLFCSEESRDSSFIYFLDIMVTDFGLYTCLAISESGDASASAFLTVVGKPFFPAIGDVVSIAGGYLNAINCDFLARGYSRESVAAIIRRKQALIPIIVMSGSRAQVQVTNTDSEGRRVSSLR